MLVVPDCWFAGLVDARGPRPAVLPPTERPGGTPCRLVSCLGPWASVNRGFAPNQKNVCVMRCMGRPWLT